MFLGIEIFSFELPLWVLLLIGIIVVLLLWKFIKFALKIALVVVVFFIILMLIDYFNVIGWIQSLF